VSSYLIDRRLRAFSRLQYPAVLLGSGPLSNHPQVTTSLDGIYFRAPRRRPGCRNLAPNDYCGVPSDHLRTGIRYSVTGSRVPTISFSPC